MRRIQQWTKDKPFLIAFFAPQMVVAARDMHELFQHTKQRRIKKHQFPLPHLPSWFALYRAHRKPLNFLRTLFVDFSQFSPESIELGQNALDELQQLARNNQQTEKIAPTPEEINMIYAAMQTILTESLMEIKDNLSLDDVDQEHKNAFLSLLADDSLAGSFFSLVYVPCWLIYRTSPTRLYRKARQGNFEALEKLLSLDPLMLHDPVIGKRIQEFRLNRKMSKYEKLLESTWKDHQLNVTPQQMKYSVGGLLSGLASTLKYKLTAPEIQKLFNAVAYEYDRKLDDPDLAVGSSFARSIYRHREDWLKVFRPDTKK